MIFKLFSTAFLTYPNSALAELSFPDFETAPPPIIGKAELTTAPNVPGIAKADTPKKMNMNTDNKIKTAKNNPQYIISGLIPIDSKVN